MIHVSGITPAVVNYWVYRLAGKSREIVRQIEQEHTAVRNKRMTFRNRVGAKHLITFSDDAGSGNVVRFIEVLASREPRVPGFRKRKPKSAPTKRGRWEYYWWTPFTDSRNSETRAAAHAMKREMDGLTLADPTIPLCSRLKLSPLFLTPESRGLAIKYPRVVRLDRSYFLLIPIIRDPGVLKPKRPTRRLPQEFILTAPDKFLNLARTLGV